jgi:hypothetical protein
MDPGLACLTKIREYFFKMFRPFSPAYMNDL